MEDDGWGAVDNNEDEEWPDDDEGGDASLAMIKDMAK